MANLKNDSMESQAVKTSNDRPIWSVTTRVRTLRRSPLWIGIDTKEIIDRVLIEKNFPKKDFLYGFSKAVNWILDSRSFEKYCEEKGYIPFQMAQQVVLAGKTDLQLTLEYGLEAVFGNSIGSMKNEFLYTTNELYDKEMKALPSKRVELNYTDIIQEKVLAD